MSVAIEALLTLLMATLAVISYDFGSLGFSIKQTSKIRRSTCGDARMIMPGGKKKRSSSSSQTIQGG